MIAVASFGVPRAAAAQAAVEAALQTDYRLRGYSLSDGQPVASLSIGYDDPSGFYVGGLASGVVHNDEPEVLLVEGFAGYAVRVDTNLSVDAGASHSHYYSGYGTSRDYRYTQFYVGAALPNVGARFSYSPNYFNADTPTLYGEINGGVEPASNWFLSAHVGALFYLEGAPFSLPDKRYDWRLGISRQLGKFGIHADVSGRIQGEAAPRGSDGAAVVLTLTRAF